jgi:hypothetical protein
MCKKQISNKTKYKAIDFFLIFFLSISLYTAIISFIMLFVKITNSNRIETFFELHSNIKKECL